MSLKSFLQMQEGGQTFVSPFAQPAPKGVTPRQMPGQTFELVTGIKREETPTTITIPEFGMPDRITPIREKEPEIFDPGVSGISAYGYTAQSPEVIAASTALGIPVTGFEAGAFYDSLVAMNQPETPFSKGMDTVFGKGLQFAAKGIVGAVAASSPPAAAALTALSVGRALSGKPPISIFGTSKEDTPATPATTSKVTTPSTATKTTIPKAMEEAIGRINQQIVSNAPAATPASVGADIFGPAYGKGGEISPGFAIGGKGSFTSFSHYGAGVSQADEASMISTGINSGVFADSQSGKDTVDAMVANGFNEAQITAAAKSTEDLQGLDFMNYQGADGGGGGGDKVICQELYDQDLLEHSIYSLDEQFGEYLRKHDLALLEGYHTWAYSVVNAMRKSKTITHIVRIVSRPVVKHIAYKMGHPSKTLLGAAMFNVGAFICRRLAKKEIVYA